MKRMLTLFVVLISVLVIASILHFDGAVHGVSPRVAEVIHGSGGWYAQPQLVTTDRDPQAIYVIGPAQPRGNRFDAVRIDTYVGAQRETSVTLGPHSSYKPFLPAFVRADVHGVRFQRPALHLMTFPGGKGPGVHHVDSATGEIVIVFEENGAQRPILTRSSYNSSSAAELLSLVSADPGGRWIAALSRTSGGWRLFLFPRGATTRRAARERMEEL
ncbi:MAG: hypothetical protein M3041_05965 [Acidobacteriota bacterium]|nr:hypothetical protein [Acidobacteriota bacterium]